MSGALSSPRRFPEEARAALGDAELGSALAAASGGFAARRAAAVAEVPEWEDLREAAARMKDETLSHLDLYLERFETRARAAGTRVHWAADAAAARKIALEICRRARVKRVVKGKSMISEEIRLNEALEAEGIETVETDLGEYIVQIRGEAPTHIIAPAIHLTRQRVAEDFKRVHKDLPPDRVLETAEDLVAEARGVLRARYFKADAGITGANMLIAETGQTVLVTNEGNGDLCQTLPRVQIVLASIEKIVPTLEDAALILRLLARSASGQASSVYTTFARGPRQSGEPEGPEEAHIILIDNGRSAMLGGPLAPMLRCIRCAACLNHCPVYQVVGGRAYGSVYPGPMGAVLTPSLMGLHEGATLAEASTFCGRCEDVCPMKIPLVGMMRLWRERRAAAKEGAPKWRRALRWWAFAAARPRLFKWLAQMAALRLRKGGRPRLAREWLTTRDLPPSEGKALAGRIKEERRKQGREPS